MDDLAKERAKDLRLQRVYGITLLEYEQMLMDQDWVCAICKNPPGIKSLSVDHDHKWKYLKVVVTKAVGSVVVAVCDPRVGPGSPYFNVRVVDTKRTRARATLNQILKKMSIRGLLCFPCNSGLRKYRDNPKYLASAAAYLEKHQVRKGDRSWEV